MRPLLLLLAVASAAAAAGDAASSQKVDLKELDRYLARKLDIVANLTAATPEAATRVSAEEVRVLYFGDHRPDETSVFQSSLSLLALLPRYSPRRVGVGFVDTAAPAGEALRRRLGVANRHAIVVAIAVDGSAAAGRQRRHEFHGFRNVQLLLDFVERLLQSPPAPRRLAGPRDKAAIDRTREAAVLLLAEPSDEAAWAGELATAAAQLPTHVGVGRRLAAAFGVSPSSGGCRCSLLYRSPAAASAVFSAAPLCPGSGSSSSTSLLAALRRLRAESVLPLGAHNLYLPAAQAAAAAAGEEAALLVLLADPDGPPGAAGLGLLQRLHSVLMMAERPPGQPPLVQLATLNPWRRATDEPDIDWAGVLGGGVSLDRGPCFLLTSDRRLGGGSADGVFYISDGDRRLATSAGEEAALGQLSRWLWRALDGRRPGHRAAEAGQGKTEL